jgi:glycine dehydrogenase subunit 1
MALYSTIYMSLMGRQGVKEAAKLSYDGAHYLAEQLVKTGKFAMTYDKPFFNEFCVSYNGNVDDLQQKWLKSGFMGGLKLSDNTLMFAVTEKRSKAEIDKLVSMI